MRHKRHDIEKFTKEGLTNYKRKSKKRLQKKKFTKEEILQKKKKTQKRNIFKPTKDKAKADFYKRQKATQIFFTQKRKRSRLQKRN